MQDVLRRLLSRPILQPLWLFLMKLSHFGMNTGGGQNVDTSGELLALDFVTKSADPAQPFILFDIGANTGDYLKHALKQTPANTRVISFEPQSASFRALQSNFGSNPNITLRQAAVGREPGSAQLFVGDLDTVSSLQASVHANTRNSETVTITTIDAVMQELSLERIDFLKIDTEGHEMDVLLGAAESLANDRIRAIQFEFGETFLTTPYHLRDLWQLLSPRFRFYRILRTGLYEEPHFSHNLEIYKLSNYLCVHRDSYPCYRFLKRCADAATDTHPCRNLSIRWS